MSNKEIPSVLKQAIGYNFVCADSAESPAVKLTYTRSLLRKLRTAALILNDYDSCEMIKDLVAEYGKALQKYQPDNKDPTIDGWRESIYDCENILDDCSTLIFEKDYGTINISGYSKPKSEGGK